VQRILRCVLLFKIVLELLQLLVILFLRRLLHLLSELLVRRLHLLVMPFLMQNLNRLSLLGWMGELLMHLLGLRMFLLQARGVRDDRIGLRHLLRDARRLLCSILLIACDWLASLGLHLILQTHQNAMALPFKITLSFSFELGLCLEHLLVILFLLHSMLLEMERRPWALPAPPFKVELLHLQVILYLRQLLHLRSVLLLRELHLLVIPFLVRELNELSLLGWMCGLLVRLLGLRVLLLSTRGVRDHVIGLRHLLRDVRRISCSILLIARD